MPLIYNKLIARKPQDPQHIIYELIDPRTDEPRYVGYSSHKEDRLSSHLSPSKLSDKSHKNSWLKSVLGENLKPVMRVVAEYETANDLPIMERFWIATYRYFGFRLTNSTDGGDGVQNPSPEARANLSNALKGRRPADITLELAAKANRGRRDTPEQRKKKSDSKKGKPLSEACRNAATAAAKKQTISQERQAKMIAGRKAKGDVWNKGKKMPPEFSTKLSAAHKGQVPINKGKKMPPEFGAKISAARKGRKPTLKQMEAHDLNPIIIADIRDRFDQGASYNELVEIFNLPKLRICRIVLRQVYDDGKKPARPTNNRTRTKRSS